MKKISLLSLLVFCVSLTTNAKQNIVVECSVMERLNQHTVQFKMDLSGNIIDWDKSHFAKNVKGDLFELFGESFDTSAVESKRAFIAPNGYSILSLTTTADNITVGVHLASGSGFYQYKDYGSGNGNSKPIVISCKTIK